MKDRGEQGDGKNGDIRRRCISQIYFRRAENEVRLIIADQQQQKKEESPYIRSESVRRTPLRKK